jgi:hypothetical protein
LSPHFLHCLASLPRFVAHCLTLQPHHLVVPHVALLRHFASLHCCVLMPCYFLLPHVASLPFCFTLPCCHCTSCTS